MLDDAQTRPPLGTCERCGGELWGAEAEPDGYGHVYCPVCREELGEPRYDPRTVTLVMGVMDKVLKEWVADGPRSQIWNAVAKTFPS